MNDYEYEKEYKEFLKRVNERLENENEELKSKIRSMRDEDDADICYRLEIDNLKEKLRRVHSEYKCTMRTIGEAIEKDGYIENRETKNKIKTEVRWFMESTVIGNGRMLLATARAINYEKYHTSEDYYNAIVDECINNMNRHHEPLQNHASVRCCYMNLEQFKAYVAKCCDISCVVSMLRKVKKEAYTSKEVMNLEGCLRNKMIYLMKSHDYFKPFFEQCRIDLRKELLGKYQEALDACKVYYTLSNKLN